jgi:hypothetical protein
MVLRGGEPLPAVSASWHTGGGNYIVLGVIVFTVWAAPAGQRRWSALPVALLALLLVGAIDLALEMQRTALKSIGYEWLPTLSFADMDINRETFARLERDYRVLVNGRAPSKTAADCFSWAYWPAGSATRFPVSGRRAKRPQVMLDEVHRQNAKIMSVAAPLDLIPLHVRSGRRGRIHGTFRTEVGGSGLTV